MDKETEAEWALWLVQSHTMMYQQGLCLLQVSRKPTQTSLDDEAIIRGENRKSRGRQASSLAESNNSMAPRLDSFPVATQVPGVTS